MDLSSLALSLLSAAVFFYVLFLVVRTAVTEGVQQALRTDLLDLRFKAGYSASVPTQDPRDQD